MLALKCQNQSTLLCLINYALWMYVLIKYKMYMHRVCHIDLKSHHRLSMFSALQVCFKCYWYEPIDINHKICFNEDGKKILLKLSKDISIPATLKNNEVSCYKQVDYNLE